MMVRRTVTRDWEWIPVAEALETAGLCSIRDYIQTRKNKIASQV